MIKTSGLYSVSKDGGKTWIEQSNILLTNYYNNNGRSNNIRMLLGTDNSEPNFNQTSLTDPIYSDYVVGVTSKFSVKEEDPYFLITQSQNYSFGLGNDFQLGELGLQSNGLYSRAVLRDLEGAPIIIPITPLDDLRTRYNLQFQVTKQGLPVVFTFKDAEYQGTLKFVNPNKWESTVLGKPVSMNTVGISNNMVIGLNNYVESGTVDENINLSSSYSAQDNRVADTYAGFAGLENLVASFTQLVFCYGSASRNNAVAIIEFEEPLVKTADDVLSLSLSILQEHNDGDT